MSTKIYYYNSLLITKIIVEQNVLNQVKQMYLKKVKILKKKGIISFLLHFNPTIFLNPQEWVDPDIKARLHQQEYRECKLLKTFAIFVINIKSKMFLFFSLLLFASKVELL